MHGKKHHKSPPCGLCPLSVQNNCQIGLHHEKHSHLLPSGWKRICLNRVIAHIGSCICRRLEDALKRLAIAGMLASACFLGHLAHLWPGAPHFLHVLGSPRVHGAMSALALLGESLFPTSRRGR